MIKSFIFEKSKLYRHNKKSITSFINYMVLFSIFVSIFFTLVINNYFLKVESPVCRDIDFDIPKICRYNDSYVKIEFKLKKSTSFVFDIEDKKYSINLNKKNLLIKTDKDFLNIKPYPPFSKSGYCYSLEKEVEIKEKC